jgi:hypothetical protein
MTKSEPELERLLHLSQAGRDHPARTLWAGQPVFDHGTVLALLSPDDRVAAKRLAREFVCLGLISPPILSSRGGRAVRFHLIHADRIAATLADPGDE